MQNTAIKINVINIVKKLFEFENKIDDKKKIYDENMLMKVRTVCQEINFSCQKTFWKTFLKQSARVFENKKRKKINLLIIKNVWNDNYFDAMNFVEQAISINDIKIIKIIVEINLKFCATKYQKIK